MSEMSSPKTGARIVRGSSTFAELARWRWRGFTGSCTEGSASTAFFGFSARSSGGTWAASGEVFT